MTEAERSLLLITAKLLARQYTCIPHELQQAINNVESEQAQQARENCK